MYYRFLIYAFVTPGLTADISIFHLRKNHSSLHTCTKENVLWLKSNNS